MWSKNQKVGKKMFGINIFTNNWQLQIAKTSPLISLTYCLLFNPAWNVLNFLIKKFSLSFLYMSDCFLTCSIMVAFISANEWPGKLKWAPVAWSITLLVIYPRCSARRDLKDLEVSPMYLLFLQFSFVHSIMYTTFEVLQSTVLFIFQVWLFVLIDFPSLISGQTLLHQGLLHFFIPFWCLLGYFLVSSGIFALIR